MGGIADKTQPEIMPVRWKIFRVVCLLQMLLAAFFTFSNLVFFFQTGSFSPFIRVLLFLLIFLLSVLAVNILNNNYPDTPVTGKQKLNFNRLFLLNFLFLTFLFGIIFSEYRLLKTFSRLTLTPVFRLSFDLLISLLCYLIVLLFQFIILYGLYVLRLELYSNFMSKPFEFEKDQLL
ncbi:MAG: hypothetical protein Q8941_08730 [Bacteroidota bacterium]|nr:hypothetical protein [Bacteroidota bacterium]